jgi:hypothetical protein
MPKGPQTDDGRPFRDMPANLVTWYGWSPWSQLAVGAVWGPPHARGRYHTQDWEECTIDGRPW